MKNKVDTTWVAAWEGLQARSRPRVGGGTSAAATRTAEGPGGEGAWQLPGGSSQAGFGASTASLFSLVESPCRSGMPPGIASYLPAPSVVSGRWARPMGASSTACLPPMW